MELLRICRVIIGSYSVGACSCHVVERCFAVNDACKLKSGRLSAIAFFTRGYKFQTSNDDWIEGNSEDNSAPAEILTNTLTDHSGLL